VDDRLRAIRARLVEQLRTLTNEVEHGLDALGSEEDRHHIADLEDLAGDSGTDSVLFEQFRSNGATLEQIQRALERLNEGTYERCEECEGAIGAARLDALPFATHCIDCKRKLEATSG
jgi:RNA polymerase-binding protein DksA